MALASYTSLTAVTSYQVSYARTLSCLGLAGSSSSRKSSLVRNVLSALIAGVITLSSHAGLLTPGLQSACLSDAGLRRNL